MLWPSVVLFIILISGFPSLSSRQLLTNKTGTNENLFPASGNLDGVISGIVFGVLIALSWGPIRRQFFEVFYYVHQLFIVGLYFGFAHSKWAFYLGITTVVIHAVDRAIRVYRGTLPCEVRAVRTLPAGQVRARQTPYPPLLCVLHHCIIGTVFVSKTKTVYLYV